MTVVLAGIGLWLPERIRTNDEWPSSFGAGLEDAHARVFNDIPESASAADVVAHHLAAEAADPFLGAKRRHIAPEGTTTIDAEARAAARALEDAGLAADAVDCVIGYSITPERITPSSAPAVARTLGIRGAFTLGVEVACAAVPAQLALARGLIATGQATNVLCTQGHLLLRGMPPLHPAVPCLGDAATAFVVTAGDGADILDVHIVTHEEHYESVTWVRVDEGGPGWWEPGGGMRLGSENIAGAKALMRDTVAYGAQTIRECAMRAQIDLERVEVALPAQRIGLERLVRQRDEIGQAVEMPDRGMNVHRLDRITAEQVDDVEHLPELEELPVVLVVPRPPAAVHVGAVRRARHRGIHDPVAAEPQVALRVAGMDRELGRRLFDAFRDQPPVQPDAVAAGRHVDAGLLQQVAGLRIEELDADVLEHRERRLVDLLEFILRHHRHRRIGEARLSPGHLLETSAFPSLPGHPAATAARPSTPCLIFCTAIHVGCSFS